MQHPSMTYFALICVAGLAAVGALIAGSEILQLKELLDAVATALAL